MRNSDIARHPLIRERFPAVSGALLAGASGQLRNLATAGGNVLQRTRCLDFQDVGKPCNKREPGSGCSAREGEHRGLAILGASPSCIATHPSDFAVALLAFDATVTLAGSNGTRRPWRWRSFYVLPAATAAQRGNAPEAGELIDGRRTADGGPGQGGEACGSPAPQCVCVWIVEGCFRLGRVGCRALESDVVVIDGRGHAASGRLRGQPGRRHGADGGSSARRLGSRCSMQHG